MSAGRIWEAGDTVREVWSTLYLGGLEGPGWQGFQLDLGQDVQASADHASWIADDDDGISPPPPPPPPDDERQLPLPGIRANSRTRSIVFRTLRLISEELLAGEFLTIKGWVKQTNRRGVGAGRMLVNAPLPKAWDRRVLNIEGVPWRFMERLIHASDVNVVWTEKTVQAALLRLHEICPDLFVRVNREEYLIPFGDLRDPTSARLARLEQWCRVIEARQKEREIRARSHDITAQHLRHFHTTVRPGRREYTGAPAFPRSAQVHPDDALEAATRELVILGPAVQGDAGDPKTFVAGCIGDDFGLSPEEFRPVVNAWNEGTGRFTGQGCDPPWRPRELEKKLQSAKKNRKRPVGCRLAVLPDERHVNIAADPANGVLTAWEHGLSLAVHAARAARVWAERRGLNAQQLLERDLVRVLSPLTVCPSSCQIGGVPWASAGYRLLLPIFDVAGELAGLRVRHVDGPEAAASPIGEAPRPGADELMAAGCSAEGLCFADETGRAMLRQTSAPREIWIGQGGPDFLTLADLLGKADERAVLGVFAASWTAAHAARIPKGARVVLATHATSLGETFARRIAATLVGHCGELFRLTLPAGAVTINDAHRSACSLELTALRPFEVTRVGPTRAVSVTGCRWNQQALLLLQHLSHEWTGPARELARTLLLCAGQRTPQAAVRGLERALLRLRERGQLPAHVTVTAAWAAPVAHAGGPDEIADEPVLAVRGDDTDEPEVRGEAGETVRGEDAPRVELEVRGEAGEAADRELQRGLRRLPDALRDKLIAALSKVRK